MKSNEKDSILTEAGTNEIEILELSLHEKYVGINVLKIREIIKYDPTQMNIIPGQKSDCTGSYIFKNECIPMVDLGAYFGESSVKEKQDNKKPDSPRILIVCEFNNNLIGFLVNKIGRIRRVSWKDIKPMPSLMSESKVMAIGVAIIDGKQLYMLDLEKIVEVIFPQKEVVSDATLGQSTDDKLRDARKSIKIFMADDSGTIRTKVTSILARENYISVRAFENGEQVLQEVSLLHKMTVENSRSLTDYIDLVLTDIEMPQLDGLTLCKKLKALSRDIKVFLLSSMITEQIVVTCSSVGADGALSKGELHQLVHKLDQLCLPELISKTKD